MTAIPQIIFIGLDTTGEDPAIDEVTAVAAIGVSRKEPEGKVLLDLEVREENTATASADGGTVLLSVALQRFERLLGLGMLGGHDLHSQWAFLRRAWERTGEPPPPPPLHWLDTAARAWPLLERGFVRDLELDTLCRFFGIARPLVDTARNRASRTVELAKRLRAEGHFGWDAPSLLDAAFVQAAMRPLATTEPAFVTPKRKLEQIATALHECANELARIAREESRL